jgi:hypothetical protein
MRISFYKFAQVSIIHVSMIVNVLVIKYKIKRFRFTLFGRVRYFQNSYIHISHFIKEKKRFVEEYLKQRQK